MGVVHESLVTMDLSYTEEQNLIRDSVQRFARESYPFDARRQLGETPEGFSRGTWKTFARGCDATGRST